MCVVFKPISIVVHALTLIYTITLDFMKILNFSSQKSYVLYNIGQFEKISGNCKIYNFLERNKINK